MLPPFGVGALYAKGHLLESLPPFLYGGDMIAEGQVSPDRVGYNHLPWKFAAGTPNVLGTIVSAQAMRLLLDLALNPNSYGYFGSSRPITADVVASAMNNIAGHTRNPTAQAIDAIGGVPGVTIYGPLEDSRRTSLVAFNVAGWNPMELADALNNFGVESRAGCHCATLAHKYLGLEPAASCRLSFHLYNTSDDVGVATDALTRIVRSRAA